MATGRPFGFLRVSAGRHRLPLGRLRVPLGSFGIWNNYYISGMAVTSNPNLKHEKHPDITLDGSHS